jgi:hypothetical protein
MDSYELKKLEDCEVLLDSVNVHGNKCVGCKKTNTNIMLVLKHEHHPNRGELGLVEVFMTKEQALQIIHLLNEQLIKNGDIAVSVL